MWAMGVTGDMNVTGDMSGLSGKGTLERTDTGPRLRFTRHLAHPPETLWRAITEPEHLAAWFPQAISLERWELGASLRFVHPTVPEATFDGEVLAFEQGAVLEFTWGTDIIRLEVDPDGEGTRLTLLDTFDELGKAARDGAGWHTCLDKLEHHLDGTSSPDSSDRWREVHPYYVEDFGPEAAMIGPPEGALD
jgi:uncharacterized protein YndB with AHSA1/START domain